MRQIYVYIKILLVAQLRRDCYEVTRFLGRAVMSFAPLVVYLNG